MWLFGKRKPMSLDEIHKRDTERREVREKLAKKTDELQDALQRVVERLHTDRTQE